MSHWDSTSGAPQQVYRGTPQNIMNPQYNNLYYQNVAQTQQPMVYTVQQIEAQQHQSINRHNSQGTNLGNRRHNESNSSDNFDTIRSRIDISNSNLQVTAEEFRPGASQAQPSNGAVKRNSNNSRGKSRVFTSRSDNSNGNRRKYDSRGGQNSSHIDSKREQDQAVRDTADILNRMKLNQAEVNGQAAPKPQETKNKNKPKSRYNDADNYKSNYRGNNGYYNNYYKNGDDWYGRKQQQQRGGDKTSDNWRQYSNKSDNKERVVKPERTNSKPQQLKKKLDAASQRERLAEMVTHRMLECLVCCERLRHIDKVWSCKQCFHILHLNCVIRWAKSSKLEEGWRCPACQNVCTEVPSEYRCYCNKYTDPPLEPGSLPHSCGNVCGRKGRGCEHTCTLLCHPGPCPDCTAIVPRSCGCGATKPMIKCSSDMQITCQSNCGKLLNCGIHMCDKVCHQTDCDECKEVISQKCYCGKNGRELPCTKEVLEISKYVCGDVCGKLLSCGNHTCENLCHDGDCEKCPADPSLIGACPCGKMTLSEERKSCLDPIPCCDKVCNKKMKCGQPSDPHLCKENCHLGDCPTCPLTTLVRCRCGHMDRELACKELTSKADDARCQKKCTKKRLCSKHKCNQLCCIEVEHICPLPCHHLLSCGLHRCEENCHRGRCPTCWRTSFEELYCECGSSVLYPPVVCGTRPPPCTKPCSRLRPCGHPPSHNCHPGACPPCTVFTTRLCHGKHESRQTIPCYQDDFSCGLPCNKELSCGRHKCIQVCHQGPCPTPCKQPCTITRANCEHQCNQPCHEPPCPNIPCKQTVTVTCQCGLKSSSRSCMELAGEYQKIAMSHLASKMADIQRGQSVDISDIVNSKQKKRSNKMLECTDECRLVDRNRRLAIGLQIRNPDLSAKLTPRYSDYMRQWVKKDQKFCQHVHDKLTELVQLAKQSKQKSRSHSFDCMNRDKRHFVHEYCEHFGCESAAYDKEPNRNIVATAYRDKSWLPSVSLVELLQRESGQRKVPGPVLNKPDSLSKVNETVSLKLQSRPMVRPATPPGEYVDYFDNPP